MKHPQAVILGGVTIGLAITAYPAFSGKTRPGHDLFSSEKPEAIRESQDAKRKEYRRQILERRAQLKADREALEKQQQQSS